MATEPDQEISELKDHMRLKPESSLQASKKRLYDRELSIRDLFIARNMRIMRERRYLRSRAISRICQAFFGKVRNIIYKVQQRSSEMHFSWRAREYARADGWRD